MSKAISRLKKACESNQRIAICGDYDADGMTSTALLFKAFTEIGAKIETAIPNRFDDGYGLNTNIIEKLNQQSVDLIITVDNGISAIVNPLGVVEARVDLNQSGFIDLSRTKKIEPTLFSKYGNKIFGLIILLYISLIFSFNRNKNE